MPRMPGAVWLGEMSPERPMDRYDIVCVHTIVGFAPAHAAHFSVRANGVIQQSRDTKYRSGANLDGNHRVIAIENEDHGDLFPNWTGSNVPSLTEAQVEANAKILRWAHETHGIPLQLCPDSRPTSRGLAYHRQGIDGNFGGLAFPGRVEGGEVWTEHFGKVCPGDRRIAQLPDILRLAKETDMPLTDDDVTKVVKALLDSPVDNDPKVTVRQALRRGGKSDEELAAVLKPTIEAAVDAAIADAVIDVNVTVGQKETPA